ncbi:MAG: hypothetical protein KC619_28415 [Myxococcales bacterium]|nr:hypothetical protein [Myxococcales bacterium]
MSATRTRAPISRKALFEEPPLEGLEALEGVDDQQVGGLTPTEPAEPSLQLRLDLLHDGAPVGGDPLHPEPDHLAVTCLRHELSAEGALAHAGWSDDRHDARLGRGLAEHRAKPRETLVIDYITGMVSTPAGLWVLHQQSPGTNNMHHFYGRWYQANDDTLDFPAGDGSMRLADAGVTGGAETVTLGPLADAAAHPADLSAQWSDQTASVEFEDPVVTEAEMFRTGTSVLLQRVSVTP